MSEKPPIILNIEDFTITFPLIEKQLKAMIELVGEKPKWNINFELKKKAGS